MEKILEEARVKCRSLKPLASTESQAVAEWILGLDAILRFYGLEACTRGFSFLRISSPRMFLEELQKVGHCPPGQPEAIDELSQADATEVSTEWVIPGSSRTLNDMKSLEMTVFRGRHSYLETSTWFQYDFQDLSELYKTLENHMLVRSVIATCIDTRQLGPCLDQEPLKSYNRRLNIYFRNVFPADFLADKRFLYYVVFLRWLSGYRRNFKEVFTEKDVSDNIRALGEDSSSSVHHMLQLLYKILNSAHQRAIMSNRANSGTTTDRAKTKGVLAARIKLPDEATQRRRNNTQRTRGGKGKGRSTNKK